MFLRFKILIHGFIDELELISSKLPPTILRAFKIELEMNKVQDIYNFFRFISDSLYNMSRSKRQYGSIYTSTVEFSKINLLVASSRQNWK